MTIPRNIVTERLSNATRRRIEAIIATVVSVMARAISVVARRAGHVILEAAFGWADGDRQERAATTDIVFDIASVRDLVVACLTDRVYAGRANPGIDDLRRTLHAALAGA